MPVGKISPRLSSKNNVTPGYSLLASSSLINPPQIISPSNLTNYNLVIGDGARLKLAQTVVGSAIVIGQSSSSGPTSITIGTNDPGFNYGANSQYSIAIGNIAQVAGSGSLRSISIGSSSKVGTSCPDSTVIGSAAVDNSGTGKNVVLGAYCSATSSTGFSTTVGYNSANSANYSIIIGANATLSAASTYGVALGRAAGSNNTQSYITVIQGGLARSQNAFAVGANGYGPYGNFYGGYQWEEQIVYASTTDATLTEMFADFTTASNRTVLPDNSMWTFTILLQARRTDTRGDAMAWKIEGSILRNTGSATTSLVGTPTITSLANSGSLTWAPTISANTTQGALKLQVTGEAAKTIKWFARISSVELNGI